MKKIKEFIKKIGNKKYCLLSLLLAGLLLFAIVGGLNGFKSAKTEVNAISAPTTKNLDLNGVRYTYQTSLNELKTNYGLFNHKYINKFFSINNDTEGLTYFSFYGYNDPDYTEEEDTIALSIMNDNTIKFEFNNQLDKNNSIILAYEHDFGNGPVFNFKDVSSLKNLTGIYINFTKLKNLPHYQDIYNNSFVVNFYYIKSDLDNTRLDEEEYMYNNSIRFAYAFSNSINEYLFKIPSINGYTCRNILCSFESATTTNKNSIEINTINEYLSYKGSDYIYSPYTTIENLNFIENGSSLNIITYNFNYYTQGVNTSINSYKGNILLSNNKFDKDFFNAISSPTNIQNLGGIVNLSGAFFGGKFNDNKPAGTLFYNLDIVGNRPVTRDILKGYTASDYIAFQYFPMPANKIIYFEQSQLLYLENLNTLQGSFNNETYDALSAQVEDILYNVNYKGIISEVEFNEKVQDDFIDLLKTTGFGAVIGLLIGFLVGNPIAGLIVGAVIGFAVALVPLLIDGLQAIFGHNFLSGLYNFFNAITEFFVNLVDTIINFLLSIITNPFVLILIVIVAIIYIFVIRKK